MEISDSAKAKLDRARHHIGDLSAVVSEYLGSHPFVLVRRYDSSIGNLSISIKNNIPIPNKIPVIAGDAVHCIRCALDHLMWALMEPLGVNKKDIQFPIWAPGKKEIVFKNRHIYKANQKIRYEIELSEPHPGGKFSICELNDLDIQDKHQLIIVAGRAAKLPVDLINIILPEFQPIAGPGSVLRYTGEEDDIVILRNLPLDHPTARRGSFEDEVEVSIPFEIVFKDGPFAGRELIQVLAQLADNVETRCIAIWAAR